MVVDVGACVVSHRRWWICIQTGFSLSVSLNSLIIICILITFRVDLLIISSSMSCWLPDCRRHRLLAYLCCAVWYVRNLCCSLFYFSFCSYHEDYALKEVNNKNETIIFNHVNFKYNERCWAWRSCILCLSVLHIHRTRSRSGIIVVINCFFLKKKTNLIFRN